MSFLEVYGYNAGKGECIRIHFGAGRNVFVDTGTRRFGTRFRQICEEIISSEAFNKLGIKPECPLEDAPVLLELWNYAPAIIGGDDIDPFSLYLTLKDDPDDRVQIALETMLKEFL